MSDMRMYNILGIMKGLNDNAKEATQLNESVKQPTVYETVEPRGSISEAVKSLGEKFATFKEGIEDKIEAAREKAAAKGKIKDKEVEKPKSASRFVKGKAYGGSAQKDAEEKDDLDEAAKPDFLDVDGDGNKKETFKKAVKDKKAVKESADPKAQKGAQAILQALSPEEEQQLAATVKQVGNNPAALAKALGITPQLIQQAEQGQVEEGIAPTLGGKIVQALYTAGLLGTTVGAYAAGSPYLGMIAAPLLMAAGTIYGGAPGQVGHNPEKDVNESGGPYELYNPKHPKFKANYDKWMAKNPGKKLADFIEAMKKREHGVSEASYSAKAARAGKDIGKPGKNFSKIAKGAAERYGSKAAGERVAGAVLNKLRHSEELDEYSQEEYNQALGDFKAKGGTVKQLPSGSAKNPISTASRHIAGRGEAGKGKPAGRGAKMDPKGKPVVDVYEKAPPGAKAERMVKHIKQGYSKDGKLTKKEKGIAYATAWKAHNKGQVEEGVEFKDTVKNSTPNLSKVKLKESRIAENTEYFYETVAKALAQENPHLNSATSEFRQAVYDEMVAQGMTPRSARNTLLADEDFIQDVASSYGHFCKDIAECGAPINSQLGGSMQELDEIAKLAGLTHETTACPVCEMSPCSCELDEREQFQSMPKAPTATPAAPTAKPGVSYDKSKLNPVREEEMEEGNEFSGALARAKAAGAKEFEVDGKRYTVKEDATITVSATLEDDALNLMRKLAGMAEVDDEPTVELPEEELDEEKERDIEYLNTPREEVGEPEVAFPSGTDLNRAKRSYADKPYRGDNPMAVKEEALWKSYESMIEDVKK